MAIDKKLFIIAGVLTIIIFILIYSFNLFLNEKREQIILEKVDNVLEGYEEMQALALVSDVFGSEVICLGLQSSLLYMDKEIWETGRKIDSYREATKEFMSNPLYIRLKKKFNREEVMYYSMLKKMKEGCEVNQTIISYFYRRAEECPDCDAQSFVLTDLNKEIDQEIAIFSFDVDLGLSSINILMNYYNVTSYPSIVIEDNIYGGLYNKKELVNLLCRHNNLSICPEQISIFLK